MQLNKMGIAGELRCVITKSDGTVKLDTGYQKNLILDQGLDFFGGGNGDNINASCAIGGGNSSPAVTQTKLDSFIAIVSDIETTSDYSYVDRGDGYYRMWEQKKYRFTGLDNVNISEVGLASAGSTSANYYLTTRALIKDSAGAATSISLKVGETLDIYYKIHKVVDTRDKAFVINVLDGNGGAVPYNIVIRPAMVGSSNIYKVSDALAVLASASSRINTGDLVSFTSEPSGYVHLPTLGFKEPYIKGSLKKEAVINLSLADGNSAIRSITIAATLGYWQMRLARVSDDAPLTKTNKETLSIPLEFSWGRYEGVL